MATITIKRTDTARKIKDTLTVDGVAFDLTSAAIKFVLRPKLGTAVVTRTASIDGDPTLGKVQYQLVTGDTSEAGEFFIEWHVTNGSGKLIFPSDAQHTLKIVEDLPE